MGPQPRRRRMIVKLNDVNIEDRALFYFSNRYH
jgi:hypothetical protein